MAIEYFFNKGLGIIDITGHAFSFSIDCKVFTCFNDPTCFWTNCPEIGGWGNISPAETVPVLSGLFYGLINTCRPWPLTSLST